MFSLCPGENTNVPAILWRRTQGTQFNHHGFVLRELRFCKQDRAIFFLGTHTFRNSFHSLYQGQTSSQLARRGSKPPLHVEGTFWTTSFLNHKQWCVLLPQAHGSSMLEGQMGLLREKFRQNLWQSSSAGQLYNRALVLRVFTTSVVPLSCLLV